MAMRFTNIPNPLKKLIGTRKKHKEKFKPVFLHKRHHRASIYKQLSVSFLLVAVISSLLTGTVGIINLYNNNSMSQNIYQQDLVPLSPLYRVQTDFLTMGTKVNDGDAFQNQTTIGQLYTQICTELTQYSSTVADSEEQATLSQMSADITEYYTQAKEALNDFVIGDSQAAYTLIDGKMATTSQHFDELINGLYNKKIAQAKQLNEESQRNFIISIGVLVIITLVSIALAVFLGRINAKQICKPIRSLVKSAEEISQGNLSVEFENGRSDEIRALTDSFKTMTTAWSGYISEISFVLSQMSEGNLDVEISSEYRGDFYKIKESLNQIITTFNEMIGAIMAAANDITDGTKQLSEGSQNLSSGAAEQAAAIDQLTASIAEIAEKTKQNAESSAKADTIANAVKTDTVGGNEKMEQMLCSMKEISESAAGISDVIKVINDIAFQTNVLALNASIEAARAGQYGKGFAVVAGEVRHLALRSTEAADGTTEMIEKSINRSVQGTKAAKDMSDTLKTIEEGVNRTTALIDSIAKSSEEQAMRIKQIYQGIDQVSRVVQTNSATAEQSAAASEELFTQAEQLRQLVSRFQVRKIETT
ncbi:MAG: HAMP domain-containing protein [Ruminococcaceae bacterium]|nr:HAMP domain-containing protein [Oscillospiraceae bacterium]